MKRVMNFLAVSACAGLVAACGGGTGDAGGGTAAPASDVVAAAQAQGSMSVMLGAMDAAGLTASMKSAQAVTLMAPSDSALSPYADDLSAMRASGDTASLKDFVQAHVVDGDVLASSLQQTGTAAAADSSASPAQASTIRNGLGEALDVDYEDGVLTINGAQIGRADLLAKNGWVHVFNAPLFAPSIEAIVRHDPRTTTLKAAIQAAGLQSTLAGKGSYTLFAPTDAAFADLLKQLNLTADQLLANKPLLTEVLNYHVLASRVLAGQVVDGSTPSTVEGQFITLHASGKGRHRSVQITDARGGTANVVQADLRARNGVVHLIDKVILPTDQDIVDIAASNPDFSILVAAVQAAGLADTLKGAGPFTVFAPTNEAFAALLAELNTTQDALLANKPLLTSVLEYHVLASRLLASGITDGLAQATVEGQPIVLHASNGAVSIRDASGRVANVVQANVQAKNGVIHAIDRVLLPTSLNLVQVAQANPDFSILVQAVTAAHLDTALAGPGPFTVFAPTNEAFAKLLGELGITQQALLGDTALLTKVLTYHVVSGEVLSSAIPFGAPVTTLQGETFTIDPSLAIVDQNGRTAHIVATDVAATNGVIHAIDTVLLPK